MPFQVIRVIKAGDHSELVEAAFDFRPCKILERRPLITPKTDTILIAQAITNFPKDGHIQRHYLKSGDGVLYLYNDFQPKVLDKLQINLLQCLQMTLELSQALHGLHTLPISETHSGIIHCRVRAANITFDGDSFQLCNFAFAQLSEKTIHCGPVNQELAFWAPESWISQGQTKSDVWALAMTVLQCLLPGSPLPCIDKASLQNLWRIEAHSPRRQQLYLSFRASLRQQIEQCCRYLSKTLPACLLKFLILLSKMLECDPLVRLSALGVEQRMKEIQKDLITENVLSMAIFRQPIRAVSSKSSGNTNGQQQANQQGRHPRDFPSHPYSPKNPSTTHSDPSVPRLGRSAENGGAQLPRRPSSAACTPRRPPLQQHTGFLPSFEALLGAGAIRADAEDPNFAIQAIFGSAKPSSTAPTNRPSTATKQNSRSTMYDPLGALEPMGQVFSPSEQVTPELADLTARLYLADPYFAFTSPKQQGLPW